jgi:hypothetical protein
MLTVQELLEKLRSVANFGNWVSLGNGDSTQKQDAHLQ